MQWFNVFEQEGVGRGRKEEGGRRGGGVFTLAEAGFFLFPTQLALTTGQSFAAPITGASETGTARLKQSYAGCWKLIFQPDFNPIFLFLKPIRVIMKAQLLDITFFNEPSAS